MKFRLALVQCRHPQNGDVPALVERWEAKAAQMGADLVAFPESLMTRYEASLGDFLAAAEPLEGPFARRVREIAAAHGLWTLFTMNERDPAGGRPFNTAVIVDDRGEVRGSYRKVHLFDTDFTRESDRMGAGSRLFEPARTPFAKIGLGICYDLRFPELARHEALAGCELLVYPAAWVDGPGKAAQWRTLLAARAIENEVFVAGLSRCDEGYIGQSAVYGPRGEALAEAGEGEELLVAEIDTDEIPHVRERMPVLDHRRPELY